MSTDAIALTRALLRYDTVNPPGRERDCARHIGALLQTWGFKVGYHEHEDSRTSSMERIRQSVAIYEDLIRDWCRI